MRFSPIFPSLLLLLLLVSAVSAAHAEIDLHKYDSADKLARYAASCSIDHRFPEAIEAYRKILELYPNSQETANATVAVKRMQHYADVIPSAWVPRLSGLDYYLIDTVEMYLAKRHYEPSQMPVNVYAYPANEDARDAVNAAMGGWNTAAAGLVALKRVDDPEQADIEIMFTTDRLNTKVADSQGTTKPVAPRNGRAHFEVTVLLVDHYLGKPISLPKLCHTVAHEFGHALGLGHSGGRSDVMFGGGAGYMPTANDIAMLKMVQTMPPDELCAKAIEVVTKAGFTSDYGVARLYATQGTVYRRLKKYDLAVESFTKAYDIHSKLIGNPELPSATEWTLRDIASILQICKYQNKKELAAMWWDRRTALHASSSEAAKSTEDEPPAQK